MPSLAPLLAVVIPTLDEAEALPLLLDDLRALELPFRVIVVDGGSSDGTPEAAREKGALVVYSPAGRARQLNAGAAAAQEPWLLFLHADSRLPAASCRALARWLSSAPSHRAAYFGFRLEGKGVWPRTVEWGQRLRERLFGLVYGDQGLLVHRDRFLEVGGYPDLPIMEDVAMLDRLRKVAVVVRLPAPLVTSPRRYLAKGWLREPLRNGVLVFLYRQGVSPRHLARLRPPRQRAGEAASPRPGASVPPRPPVLLVFARTPVEGQVKTRLAHRIGDAAALRVYRRMARDVVDSVRAGPWRTVVCHDSSTGDAPLRDWLGPHRLEFRRQGEGDLGTRMQGCLAKALEESRKVCLIGTDAPGLGKREVEAAFRALEDHDVVLGPALDGGYYLVGLNRPAPELFRDIPWSTDAVLGATLDRARAGGLRVTLLEPLQDVDTLEDLERVCTAFPHLAAEVGRVPP